MTDALDQFVGERIGGRFIVERAIGHGPLSSAFRARDERLHRRVTVKLYHPRHPDDAQVVRAQLELARAVARLSHDHIAVVIDRGEHEGLPFVVYEHVRGENLKERIDRLAPLDSAEVVRIGVAVARALAYAHGHGVMHGNLRPENVLVSEDHDVKLVDFGGGSWLAQLVESDPLVAPERRGRDEPDAVAAPPTAAEDVYGLGALLYSALVADDQPRPDLDASYVQLQRPDVSPRMAAVVARALAREPEERHATMRELAGELAAIDAQLRAASAPPAAHAGQETAHGDTVGTDQLVALDAAAPLAPPSAPVRGRGARTGRRQRRDDALHGRQRRARLLAWSMVLLPIGLVALVGLMIAGERSLEGASEGEPSRPNVEAEPIELVAASSYDPFGDQDEHGARAELAIDGDPETSWSTESYDTPDMADKPGVGLVVEPARAAELRELRVATDLFGFEVEVYGVEGAMPPQTEQGFEQWTQVAEATPIVDAGLVEVDTEGEQYDRYLVWITSLSLDTESLKGFVARTAELRATAIPAD